MRKLASKIGKLKKEKKKKHWSNSNGFFLPCFLDKLLISID
jgi:hypothetical protein